MDDFIGIRIKIKLHREICGIIKTCSIIEKNGKYYAYFACEVEASPIANTGEAVGIDMWITDFCITSKKSYGVTKSNGLV